ncbi:MAG: CoA transferase [Sinobacteraceae bacterium]|nr:CoA transferase [Nevskiaceae bacterium]
MNAQPKGVLAGLRLVEVSAFVAAPSGGLALAQLGADVIRVDPPGGGLDYHRWPVTAHGDSLFWAGLNKCKRSVVIDTSTDEGRELAMALICAPGEGAGLLLTNLSPKGWLSYEALSKRRPDLIQLTVMGTRHGGSAVDYTVNPTLGIPMITGPAGQAEPVNHVLPAWDLITGQMAALGLLAAERHRRCSGEGQHVKLALEDVGLAVMGHLGFIAEAQLGQTRGRYGNELYGAFGRDFVCADGQRIMVVALTSKQWKALVKATGIGEDVAKLERELGLDLGREGDRFRARERIAALVAPWIGARRCADVAQCFDQAGVCWSRYQSVAQLASSAAVDPTTNSMFSRLEQPGIGIFAMPASPLDFASTGRLPPRPAPRLGEHTEEVLCGLLGLSGAEFGRLHDKGVVVSAQSRG